MVFMKTFFNVAVCAFLCEAHYHLVEHLKLNDSNLDYLILLEKYFDRIIILLG